MLYPDRITAENELILGGTMNPGPWTDHSRNTARACENIAARVPGMDAEKAYILGLMHDIGRRAGIMQERHIVEGYRYCTEHGWNDAAKICITHSFMIRDIDSAIGDRDTSDVDLAFLTHFLQNAEYNEYDKLVQLCDSLALPSGFCILEKRFVDVCLRYGTHPNTVPRWKAVFAIKKEFDSLVGDSVYGLLPGIETSTFH